jgi:tRNA (5-methylaminomethyl-2-thiouridylate)-methyltransferase
VKTAVLVSGGVDSSVALRLLAAERGEQLVAFYLKIWLEDELSYLGRCPWEEDLELVRAVSRLANVPLEVISLQREYHERVVAHALDELRAGRTPSPDIFCNQRIKFGAFCDAVGNEFSRVASGHYARVRQFEGRSLLLRGVDPAKDQTYFLSHLDRAQVARCEFPIGGFEKREVRRLAREYGLPTSERPDSQGICFLGKLHYDDFVRAALGERPGKIRDFESGAILGEHRGYWFHTIGQRRGLRLGGGPWYVVGKDIDENIVWVAHQSAHASHARRRFEVERPHWIHDGPPLGQRLLARIRHTPELVGCIVQSIESGRTVVELDEPDCGVAPGQFVVIYDGEICLGGARIAG